MSVAAFSAPQSRRLDPTPHVPAALPAVPADEASGHGNPFRGRLMPFFQSASRVEYIEPVDGWSLFAMDEPDGDGFWTTSYVARCDDGDVMLHTSRFRFTPSQERFAWLVRHGFPRRPGKILGPWCDLDIEAAIEAERAVA